MPKRQVFYSFHYKNDVMRVQQIRNIGVIEGNIPVSSNTWEEIERKKIFNLTPFLTLICRIIFNVRYCCYQN